MVSLTVPGVAVPPSPQSMEQVWLSFVPASVNDAETDTGEPGGYVPGAGELIVTTGFAFATVTVAVLETGGLLPSSAVSLTVNAPSSLHVNCVVADDGAENEHVVPGSTPGPAVYVHSERRTCRRGRSDAAVQRDRR